MLNQMHSRTVGKQLLTIFLTLSIFISPLLWRGAGGEVQAQSYQWAHGFGGPNYDSQGNSIATDAQGNVYVTGTFGDSIDFDPGAGSVVLYGNSTTFIAKYDSSGVFVWAKSLDSSPGDCIAEKIVVNNTGVYLTGHFFLNIDFDPGPGTALLNSVGGWNGDEDIFIAHYDLNGNYLWAKSMGGLGEDKALDMTSDNDNNLYIIGYFANIADLDPGVGSVNLGCNNSGGAAFFGKYDNNGNLIWVYDLCDTSAATGGGGKIAFDSNNNDIYISGYFSGTIDFDRGVGTATITAVGQYDPYIAKYDTSGSFIWAGSLSAASSIGINAIYIDHTTSDILITSSFWGVADFDLSSNVYSVNPNNNYSVIYFAKYSSNGNLIWIKQTNSTGNLGLGKSIITDNNSNVYLAGYYTGTTDFDPDTGIANITSNGGEDIFFAKYDSAGNYSWARSIGGLGYYDQPTSIVLDVAGSIYLTGYFINTMDADPDAGVAILNPSISQNIFVGKYKNVSTDLEEKYLANNQNLIAYPNPAFDNINILLPEQAISIDIYTSLGDLVYSNSITGNNFKSLKQINISKLASGVYYLKFKANGNSTYYSRFIKQ